MTLIKSTFDLFITYKDVFISGILATIQTSMIVVLFGTFLGSIISLLNLVEFKPLNMILNFYISFIRGTPLLLQLYFFYLLLPNILNMDLGTRISIIIALVINSSAYVAEIFRAGIQAIDIGQFEASQSLGMDTFHMMVKIILPQAIKNILPALGNELIMMIKETSLSSTFFIPDIMTSFQIVSSGSYLPIESLIIVGVIYFVLTSILTKGVSMVEKSLSYE